LKPADSASRKAVCIRIEADAVIMGTET
jgi:hypothetical protein